MSGEPLRILLLTYRGNPRSGGQGIYIRNLSRELAALGHEVHVWSGPPYPELDPGPVFRPVPSLDLWNEAHFFRVQRWRDLLDPIHFSEWARTMTGAFPEPRTFCQRVVRLYKQLPPDQRFDIVHDNQALGPGLLRLQEWVPVVTTIHHPITVDRRLALAAERSWRKRIGLRRWYSFIPMQVRVAQRLGHIITVSRTAARDIQQEFGIPPERIHVVEVGVDTRTFRPLEGIQRLPDRIMTTVSADVPLKGFDYLLEAFAQLRRHRPGLSLTVIGAANGRSRAMRRIQELGLNGAVRLTGRVPTEEIVRQYAQASVAVVPSLYEGFGLPAAEAMACKVPVVSTRAGALPEVVGEDGRAGILVPPGDSESLGRAIAALLDAPERRVEMGEAGRARVEALFTWRRTAERTVDLYRQLVAARRRGQRC